MMRSQDGPLSNRRSKALRRQTGAVLKGREDHKTGFISKSEVSKRYKNGDEVQVFWTLKDSRASQLPVVQEVSACRPFTDFQIDIGSGPSRRNPRAGISTR